MNMQLYRNKKSGTVYQILGEAINVTDNVMQEGYLYAENTAFYSKICFRSKDEFHEKFEPAETPAPPPQG